LSYEGYAVAIPRSPKEKLVFQQLLNKKMRFRAPETGQGRCRELHFRFKSGESTLDSEKTDRRRNRSPEGQEAARKRHRNHKDGPDKKLKCIIFYFLFGTDSDQNGMLEEIPRSGTDSLPL
jgi:hypothetical protein